MLYYVLKNTFTFKEKAGQDMDEHLNVRVFRRICVCARTELFLNHRVYC